MKRRFADLTETEQATVELTYHQLNPDEFDELMTQAKQQVPALLRLPSELVENLKTVAETEGEPEYQTMVQRWIVERLQLETSLVDDF